MAESARCLQFGHLALLRVRKGKDFWPTNVLRSCDSLKEDREVWKMCRMLHVVQVRVLKKAGYTDEDNPSPVLLYVHLRKDSCCRNIIPVSHRVQEEG